MYSADLFLKDYNYLYAHLFIKFERFLFSNINSNSNYLQVLIGVVKIIL